MENAGEGNTLVLGGMAVLTTGRVVAPQEGIVDMSGPGADYTPFSRTCNVVLSFDTAEDLEPHQREACYRIAGLKAAHYLASACKDAAADSVEAYDFPPLAEAMHQHPGLPKVAYMYMLQSQGLLHDTWVYGVDAKRILPTMISPTELMDGAIISGNCVSACDKNNTYVHLNNPVVKSLYEHHGKDLNFVGVIITNENVTLADKKRSSSYAVKLARMLGVDAVVISEEGFGNPDADLIMNWRASRPCSSRMNTPGATAPASRWPTPAPKATRASQRATPMKSLSCRLWTRSSAIRLRRKPLPAASSAPSAKTAALKWNCRPFWAPPTNWASTASADAPCSPAGPAQHRAGDHHGI